MSKLKILILRFLGNETEFSNELFCQEIFSMFIIELPPIIVHL